MAKLTYPATTAYKQWVWKELVRREWTLQRLVNEMKRVDRSPGKVDTKTVSTGTLTQLLGEKPVPGSPPPRPEPSNSYLLLAINKALGIAPPPVCDPSDELSQLRDRFVHRWNELTPKERQTVLSVLADDSEANTD